KNKLGHKKNNVFKAINTENSINLNIQSDKKIKNIIFACDAGMGSSAMGASILRKKIKEAKLFNISVSNTAINLLPNTVDLVITHQNLTKRAKMYALNSQHISLKNFLDYDFYDTLVKKLSDGN
ncbi:PTS mannitol transporter subunit IICBA, partial [Buchnera aphidicola]|nr:PTS mannitol transporter subunit IICBA [Buchnera aphidicola]